MILSLSPTQSQTLQALRDNFLQQVLPQGNALFSGGIGSTTLNVTAVQTGILAVGDYVFGAGVAPGTLITAFGSGSGGIGTYAVNNSQSISGTPLNTGVPVLQGQQNFISQPSAQDYVIITPINRRRIETNIDTVVDCYFQASIAAYVLTVATIAYGTLGVGRQLFGVGIAAGTIIRSQLTGSPGGPGTYQLNISQAVATEGMACGTLTMLQPTELLVQCDVYGPNSADYAQIITTAFRDEYGYDLLAASGFPIAPLYADDPKQMPLVDGEQNWESRWIVEARLQVNQSVIVPQQFADEVNVVLVSVDATYPPS